MGFGDPFSIEDGSCFQELQPLVDSCSGKLQHASSKSLSSSTCSAGSFSCCGCLPLEMVQSLSSDLHKQSLEMDLFLKLENNRLRKLVVEQGTCQQALLVQQYESRTQALMLQKDEEIKAARNRTRELQSCLSGSEIEAKAWEQKALQAEATVRDLNNKLIQAKEKEDDTTSFCGSSTLGNSKIQEMVACKLCQSQRSCVVLFPCRHLCCCRSCDSLLGHCPVCATVKEGSLQVFLG